ncbi:hypothetical protein AYI68_g3608, partial [Smittium mucronatum]
MWYIPKVDWLESDLCEMFEFTIEDTADDAAEDKIEDAAEFNAE